MPPKKPLTISELKKQLAAEKKKKEEKAVKIVPPTGAMQAGQVKVRAKEEDARRKFFQGLLKKRDETSDEELLQILQNFGAEPRAQLFRQQFIKQIATKLSAPLIYEYAQGYVDERDASGVYLKKFLSDPRVMERLESMAEAEGEEEELPEIPEEIYREEDEGEKEVDYEEGEDVARMAKDLEKVLLEEPLAGAYEPAPGPDEIYPRNAQFWRKIEDALDAYKFTEKSPLKIKPKGGVGFYYIYQEGDYYEIELKDSKGNVVSRLQRIPKSEVTEKLNEMLEGTPAEDHYYIIYPKKKTKLISETWEGERPVPGEEIEFEEYRKTRIPKAEVGAEPKIPLKYLRDFDGNCARWYRETPWLPGRASAIWFFPLSWDEGSEFYHEDEGAVENTKIIDGRLFHRANQNFIRAQCNFYRNKRKQEGVEFFFYDRDGEEVSAEVAFEVRGKFIAQNEEIFQKEKESYINLTEPLEKKIRNLLGRSIQLLSDGEKEDLKRVIRNYFGSLLRGAGVSESQGEEWSQWAAAYFYINESGECVKMLFEKYALFLAYFDPALLSYAKTFKERLVKGAYSADFLVSITPVEVIPEIYLDPRVDQSNREIFTRFMFVSAADIYMQLAYTFYCTVFPQERREVIPMKAPLGVPPMDLPAGGLQGLCANQKDLPANISPYNLYIYKEGEKYYCFDLSQLPEEFTLLGEAPGTDIPVPEKVFEEITRLAALLEAAEEVTPAPVEKPTEELIAPGLLEFIIEEVASLEDEMGVKGRNLLSELEQYKEEGGPEAKEKSQEISKKVEAICGYCQKFLGGPPVFSSIVQGKEGSKLLEFCNTECFEKMEKWPKLRKRKEALEKQYQAKLEAEAAMKPKEAAKEPEMGELPCFYPAECETNQSFSNEQIRQIAEKCEINTKTAKGGIRTRKNICGDLRGAAKEKTKEEGESDCAKCKAEIAPGTERALKDEVLCRRCFEVETLVKKMMENDAKMAKEKEKLCAQCEKFIGDDPAWRSTDWGHGVVHYCSLKCFQAYDPDTGKQVKKATELEEERKKQLDAIVKRSSELKKSSAQKEKKE